MPPPRGGRGSGLPSGAGEAAAAAAGAAAAADPAGTAFPPPSPRSCEDLLPSFLFLFASATMLTLVLVFEEGKWGWGRGWGECQNGLPHTQPRTDELAWPRTGGAQSVRHQRAARTPSPGTPCSFRRAARGQAHCNKRRFLHPLGRALFQKGACIGDVDRTLPRAHH